MPILTKAGSPVKGSSTLFTLDKAELAAVTSVAADTYFSDLENWKSVSLIYNSSVGNQLEVVKFDATLSSPASKFLASEYARDVFLIQKIVIKDFDGGSFDVLRSELTAAETEFDVDMTPPPSFYTFNSFSVGMAQDLNGYVYKSAGSGDLQAASSTSVGLINGSFSIEYELKHFDLGMAAWIYLSSASVINAGYTFGIKLNGDGSISFKQPTGVTTLTGNTTLNGTTTEIIRMNVSGGVVQVVKNGSVINNFELTGTAIDSTPLYPYVLLDLGGPYDNVANGKNLIKALVV